MRHDDTQGVRRRVANEVHQPNAIFAEYVQSTAFSLSLSRRQIGTLVHLEAGIANQYEYRRWPIDVGRINQLVRRGLVTHHYAEGDPTTTWADNYRITAAGHLVLALLVEAGLIDAVRTTLPPPPPGWVDPRPKVIL